MKYGKKGRGVQKSLRHIATDRKYGDMSREYAPGPSKKQRARTDIGVIRANTGKKANVTR